MKDHWDELNNHPARIRMAEFSTRKWFKTFLDQDEDLVSVAGEVDYKVDSQGLTILFVRFWPYNEFLEDAVHDYCVEILTEVDRP